jgi:hypothetical protein
MDQLIADIEDLKFRVNYLEHLASGHRERGHTMPTDTRDTCPHPDCAPLPTDERCNTEGPVGSRLDPENP